MPRTTKGVLASVSAEQMDVMSETMTDEQISVLIGDCTKNNVGYRRRALGVKSYGEKHGIVVGVSGVSNPTNRKYHFDEKFFSVIDSEIKAYALGLFFTDGHITKQLHRARLALTEADSGVLNQIAVAAKLNCPLLITKPTKGNYQVHNMVNLSFNSTTMVKDLIALGLSPSKVNNTKLPIIPSELDCHLVRGIIDGDGSITSVLSYAKSSSVGDISGREDFLISVNNLFKQHGFPECRIAPMKSIYQSRLYKKHLSILDWCYGCSPTIVIQRKFEQYSKLKKFLNEYC